jgi:hypothetical protein
MKLIETISEDNKEKAKKRGETIYKALKTSFLTKYRSIELYYILPDEYELIIGMNYEIWIEVGSKDCSNQALFYYVTNDDGRKMMFNPSKEGYNLLFKKLEKKFKAFEITIYHRKCT